MVSRGPADNREQDLSPADVRNIPDEIESEVKGDKARSLWKRASERFPNLDAGTFVDHLVEYLLHRDKYEDLFSQQSLFQEPSETPANSAVIMAAACNPAPDLPCSMALFAAAVANAFPVANDGVLSVCAGNGPMRGQGMQPPLAPPTAHQTGTQQTEQTTRAEKAGQHGEARTAR